MLPNFFFTDGTRSPSVMNAETQPGTKENKYCSGRGICDQVRVIVPVTSATLPRMEIMPSEHAVTVGMSRVTSKHVQESFPAQDMASVWVILPTNVNVPVDGRVQ